MFPLDRRILAAHVYSLLHSLRKTALILKVSHTTISRWLKDPNRKQYPSRKATKSEQVADTIRIAIQTDPFTTLSRLRKCIEDTFSFTVSRELIRTAIKKMGLSRKNAKFFSQPAHLPQTTAAFLRKRDQFIAEGRLFVSLDETSFGRNGRDSKGYAPVGKALVVKRTNARMTTLSSLVAMTKECIISRKEVIGSFNTERFTCFLSNLTFYPSEP